MLDNYQDSIASQNDKQRSFHYSEIQQEFSSKQAHQIPAYIESVYYWSYINPRNVNWLDREWIVKIILWWQHARLRNTAFCEIKAGDKVLQTAAVYGIFSSALAKHLGVNGQLNVIDIAPIQVSITQKKLSGYPNTNVSLEDATTCQVSPETKVILSYFLLHEVPDDYKQKILDNLLNQLPLGSKLVLVDYHKPHWAHPLKPLMSVIFNTLEPFAKSFWKNDIKDFSEKQNKFNWEKSTFFGGLYQKVVVTRK